MQIYQIPMTNDLQEITGYRAGNFPVVIYTTVVKDNVYGYIPLHWHNELQFVLVTNGCVKFSVDHTDFLVRENEGIFINSGWLHSARAVGGDNSAYICVDFLPEFIATQDSRIFSSCIFPIINNQMIKGVTLHPDKEWQKQILNSIRLLEQTYYDQKSFYELRLKCEICSIWSTLVENFEIRNDLEISVESKSSRRIKDMLEYIHSHYDTNITLEDLANVSNLSRSECSRTFKKSVDSTPFEYIKRYRIAQGMQLLANEDKSITEIALAVGFNSSSYFISAFRKIVGMTPSEYRKQIKPV